MACPTDGTQLVMSERQGIEIDYCPTCRGVWLDRGELDKIIERSAPTASAAPPQHYAAPQHGQGHYKHRRRKSFLEELFD
jgi:Zn-finger nucleic acid-binding protein